MWPAGRPEKLHTPRNAQRHSFVGKHVGVSPSGGLRSVRRQSMRRNSGGHQQSRGIGIQSTPCGENGAPNVLASSTGQLRIAVSLTVRVQRGVWIFLDINFSRLLGAGRGERRWAEIAARKGVALLRPSNRRLNFSSSSSFGWTTRCLSLEASSCRAAQDDRTL